MVHGNVGPPRRCRTKGSQALRTTLSSQDATSAASSSTPVSVVYQFAKNSKFIQAAQKRPDARRRGATNEAHFVVRRSEERRRQRRRWAFFSSLSVEKIESQYMPEGGHSVLPVYLLPFLISPARIGYGCLIYPVTFFCDPCGNLRLKNRTCQT